MTERLTKRNGVWHFVRRVPEPYAAVDPRGIVKLSTKIKVADDRAGVRAGRVAKQMDLDLQASWRALAAGTVQQASINVEQARALARALGLHYKPVEAVVQEGLADILARVDQLALGARRDDAATTAAVLGGVPLPEIMLSTLCDEFFAAKRTASAKKSPGQLKKWMNGKRNAAALLISVVGDKAIHALTRDNALKFAEHWEQRVLDDEVKAGTANRNLTHITGMLRAVSKRHQLRLEPVFAGTRLEGDKARSRPPFTAPFIVSVMLAPGALDAMNVEERAAVHVIINTGARPSEIVNLRRPHIILDSNIPFIRIRPDDRELKTDQSERDIPLVGIALEAMRAFPDGFPRYRDNGDSFSAAVNKFFAEHSMKPTELHTLYSLRHGFKDRLRDARAPDELTNELMGHATGKPKYGDGHGLEVKLHYLSEIALAPGMVLRPQLVRVPGLHVPGAASRG
ncbi:tyrosine-type recombinase/integrase [Bradyrhizobium sp. KBS0727]|uniref:tyrosine-type recombinase/integrase n=1 Tax=unclassified Bradyrhizobium TaxID=2631580 RepID=UPI00110F14BA|nr:MULTISPECIES: tyrosine-type recombinase/integrase [unclassified Bradyrhizobium]QDW39035.1 tyrosine-type recombinase/integrase [Bradyrhizobium sp. KBS0725]QDW45638.1 tyrosine-type recombinase/integrase [Bradyrhizobium sp. KBS0727]